MNELQVFNFEQNQVRIIEKDGEFWFVAKDVCDVLELENPTKSIKSLDDDEKMTLTFREDHSGQRGGAQFLNIINESGLYALVLRSNKPEAKRFSKWVRSEVLPSIRKHGAYMTQQTLEKALTNPDFLIQLAQQLKSEQEKNKVMPCIRFDCGKHHKA